MCFLIIAEYTVTDIEKKRKHFLTKNASLIA